MRQCACGIGAASLETQRVASKSRRRYVHKLPLLQHKQNVMVLRLAHHARPLDNNALGNATPPPLSSNTTPRKCY